MLNVQALEAILKPVISESLERLPFVMQAYIGTNMEFRGAADRIAPSTSSKLAINTGVLFRSFTKGQTGNIFKVSQNGGNFELEYGSELPYAAVQEFGGFIRSKGNMHKYFWARYAETKQPYFKNIALSVKKKGGVNIPARPYFNPAVNRLRQDDKFSNSIKQQVISGIQKWQESQRRSNQ